MLWTFAMYKNESQEALAQKHPKAFPRGPKRHPKKNPKAPEGCPKTPTGAKEPIIKLRNHVKGDSYIYIYIYVTLSFLSCPFIVLWCSFGCLWVSLRSSRSTVISLGKCVFRTIGASLVSLMSRYWPVVILWVPVDFFGVVPLDSHFSGQVCASHDRGIDLEVPLDVPFRVTCWHQG